MKTKKSLQLLIAELSADKKKVIMIEDRCLEVCSHEDLMNSFKDRTKECAYAIYDFREKNKLILIKWYV
jgi:hypothetical protein